MPAGAKHRTGPAQLSYLCTILPSLTPQNRYHHDHLSISEQSNIGHNLDHPTQPSFSLALSPNHHSLASDIQLPWLSYRSRSVRRIISLSNIKYHFERRDHHPTRVTDIFCIGSINSIDQTASFPRVQYHHISNYSDISNMVDRHWIRYYANKRYHSPKPPSSAADSTINTASAADSTLNTAQNPHSSASYNSTTPSPATSNHNDTNLDLNLPCDDGPDGLHAAMSANVDGVADNPKHKQFSRHFTTNDARNELYYNQQCDVVRLAIRNRVAPHLFFSHLGINRRMRGNSSWNNFQHEDPEAQRLRANQEGGEKVSLAWASKSDAEKARYRDRDYLQSLRQGSSDSPHASDPKGLVKASKGIVKKDVDFGDQLGQKSTGRLASRHPKSTIFRKGGSSFGSGFMDMVAETTDADFAAEFHTWVAAQAIQISKGCTAWLPRKSRIKPSGDERDEFNVLKNMISIATGKKVSCGWPGENTETRLRELKLSLEIDTNKWSVEPKDFMQPLDYLKDGVDRAILACLGLNKVHLTYHSEWDDVPTARKKSTKRKDGERDPDDSANVQEEQGSDATGPHDRNAASTGHNSSNTNNEEEAQAHHDNNHRPAKRARVGLLPNVNTYAKTILLKLKDDRPTESNPPWIETSKLPQAERPDRPIQHAAGEPSTAANGGSRLRPEVLDPMLDLLR
ncbi:hypothetical protein KEM48_004008 [Puccinia striiformis f. sp. tritici PST-130]|nr:hypothetical protein KEM48_004008 [Puccinia striiformis f. sp. tritici PST-130]